MPTLTAWFLNIHNKSAILHRQYGVKVKLSYKSEGLERLFLQLIKEKLTNLDKFSQLNYHKILNPPPPPTFCSPTRISEKNFPH